MLMPHFRLYFVALNLTTSCDVLLQPLVDRRWLPPRAPLHKQPQAHT